jgi:hypothetical protein
VNNIEPVQGTNTIRYADFMRLTVGGVVYLFATTPTNITISGVGTFTGLSQLVSVGSVQRDIKSTANETTVSLVGIDTAMLGLVLGSNIKGSKLELWHGFFDSDNQLITSSQIPWINDYLSIVPWTNNSGTVIDWTASGLNNGLYQYFSGFVNSFTISENWMEEVRMFTGTVSISASSFQLVLQNRTAGRYTNNNSWQNFAPTDTSMNRVNFIETINYYFGKDAPNNS